MIFEELDLPGAYLIKLEPKEDSRGSFSRIFCHNKFIEHELSFNISQCNLSINSKKNTLRGLHYQKIPHEEDKIVTCIKGTIFDVIVDLRVNSPTYRKFVNVELSSTNNKSLYVPKGFAHGFQTLVDYCEILYFMSTPYVEQSATGIRWNDPTLSIKWPSNSPIISKKDKNLPLL